MSKRIDLLKFGAAMMALSGVAHAQTSPSQTPPGATALETPPPTVFSFPPAQGLAAPAGAADIRFTLTDIEVEGQYEEVAPISAELEAQREGREVSVSDVYGFAAELQQAYFNAGFPLARVVVPPQELGADGRVRVVVVDGFVERIDVAQVPEAARRRVSDVLQGLVGARRPTRGLIERKLLLAGDTAGVVLSSALSPGGQTGATVLVVTGEHDPFYGVAALDTRVSDQLGGYQGTVSGVLNSPFGGGERLYATFAGYPSGDVFSDDARRRFLSVGVDTPLGSNGLMLGLSADYSTTRPGGDLAAQRLSSEYSRVGVSMSYPVVRSRKANLNASVQLDAISDFQRTDIGGGVTLSADRYRALRLGLDGDAVLINGARIGYSLAVSKGLDIWGARTQADATPLKPLSRAGADADFASLNAGFRFDGQGPGGVNVAVTTRAGISFEEPLLRAEQFSPAGWDGLSGPPPGLMIGDYGAVGRVELDRPFQTERSVIAPYAFAAAASVGLEQPTALEDRNAEAHSAGVGLRFGYGPRERRGYALSFTLEWAAVQSDDRDIDGDWTNAAIAVRF
ncbi:MAG: ShlB/FhaC/HecB family hemolysin secretion/activation protein [Hyphomonadaceae bacterium]